MAESFRDAWKVAKHIQGWLYRREGKLLWDLCDGPWCEIGSWKGRSARVLAATGNHGWCIDHFHGSPSHDGEHEWQGVSDEFARNLHGLPVTVIDKPFRDAVDQIPDDIQLLHLDADHEYEPTKAAFDLYSPKVRSGGFVFFHDAHPGVGQHGWPDTARFCDELPWPRIADVGRFAVFRKP